jgi:hypothetical protein
MILSAVACVAVGFPGAVASSPAASAAVAPCAASAVRITDYNTLVGAGSVNDLFWIKNVSSQACSLRGYVRVEYIGVYGVGTPYRNPRRLSVGEVHSYGRDGNDIGGLEKGLPIPSVTLDAQRGVASFWLAGTDESHGSPPSRCIDSRTMLVWLPGSSTAIAVHPLRANGFYWCGSFAAHPILPGRSGSDPPKPLTYYFGTPS